VSKKTNHDKLGVTFLATVTLLSIGFGFYAQSLKPTPEDVSPQDALTRSLKQSVATAIPEINNPNISDWEKVNLLRRWAYQNSDLTMAKGCLIDSPDLRPKSAAEIFSSFQKDEGGVWCAGMSIFLMKLYEQYGFESYALNMGKPSAADTLIMGNPPVGSSITHVLVLVKIPHKGRNLLVVQDGYLNNTYTHLDGSPLDYFELIKLLKNRQENKIKVVRDQGASRDNLLCSKQIPPQIWEVSTKQLQCEQIPGKQTYKCKHGLTLDLLARYSPLQKEINRFFPAEGYPPNLLFLFLYPLGIEGASNAAPGILKQAQKIAGITSK
jgi:hypothetical protein